MRPFLLILTLFAAASLVVFGSGTTVQAQTPPSPAAISAVSASQLKPRTWLVENNDRLVTVREKDGPPLFAQVIANSDLVVEVDGSIAKKRIALTLKEVSGKRIYQMPFPFMKQGNFEFAFTGKEDPVTKVQKGGGTSFTLSPSENPSDSKSPQGDAQLRFVIGSDNIIAGGEAKFGKDRMVVERKGMRITATYFENGSATGVQALDINMDSGKGTGTLSVNGKEAGSFQIGGENEPFVLRDEQGTVTMRYVKQDGKDYAEFTLGERKILVEGANWNFALKDGVLTLKPNSTAAPTVTTTANK